MKTAEKLKALRAEMAARGLDAYVIPTDDYHGSEYVGDYFKSREYVSGFTGSAGTLVVMKGSAALWTDGRYFLQAADQLAGSEIVLMKAGEPGVPEISEYIAENIPKGGKAGFDGRTVRESFADTILKAAGDKKVRLCGGEDLVDLIWTDRPEMSKEPVWEMDESVCGQSRAQKLALIRSRMKDEGADVLVIAALDEIAWLLNLRGGDVACTPVFLSYMVIDQENARLFASGDIFSGRIRKHLKADGICISAYNGIERFLKRETEGKTVWADGSSVNWRLMNSMKKALKIIKGSDPVHLIKAVKNEAETAGMREAHIRDGIAMCRFLYWLDRHVGREKITEISAAQVLHDFRAQQEGFLEDSFDTIMGYGPHGAIVHYEATEETNAEIFAKGLLLIDSGGHYECGTTDITRTVVCGPLSEEEKKFFTLVLKGHLALQAAQFRYKCSGASLDVLARGPLWAEGYDYNHGTGHGVGLILSVHEGPQRIHYNASATSGTVLEEGMIVSDEPGFYLAGKFGIRHENLVLVKKAEQNEYGQFMKFEPLTMVPIDKAGIDISLMDEKDIERLNAYHSLVWDAISPYLQGEEKEWFREATAPVSYGR